MDKNKSVTQNNVNNDSELVHIFVEYGHYCALVLAFCLTYIFEQQQQYDQCNAAESAAAL